MSSLQNRLDLLLDARARLPIGTMPNFVTFDDIIGGSPQENALWAYMWTIGHRLDILLATQLRIWNFSIIDPRKAAGPGYEVVICDQEPPYRKHLAVGRLCLTLESAWLDAIFSGLQRNFIRELQNG